MSVTHQDTRLASAEGLPLEQRLVTEWKYALSGDKRSQAQWLIHEGGVWVWRSDGLFLTSSGAEWSAFAWQTCNAPTLKDLTNFIIEVTVSGKAAAAGLSFGPYKDFLTGVDSQTSPHRLQLEVDIVAERWTFRVDGQLMARCWWDSEVRGVNDLVGSVLSLKAQSAEYVLFQDLAIHTFQSSCQLSVIMTCYRFQQRLRVSLRNWCHQDLPAGAYEILVVNPSSPDGTHELLAAVTSSYPYIRVREVVVESSMATNKGAMINRAVDASRGEWLWLTDADCLYSSTCAGMTIAQIKGRNPRLFYGQRRHLSASQTNALLSGQVDGLRDFESLARHASPRAPDHAPWGYTQIVHRSTLQRVRYREEVNHFDHSDDLFVADCKRHRIMPAPIDGLYCLHLDHPFAWYGTTTFL